MNSFQHNFHDAQLVNFELGPRRELSLQIAVDPVWNERLDRSVTVRFGGIENYDEVAAYFRALPKPARAGAYIAEIIGLKMAGETKVAIELADIGCVRVQARHVSES